MNHSTWYLPKKLLSESIEIMRPHGQLGCEGLALWLGYEKNNDTYISHMIELYGPGFKTSPLHMSLSLSAMASLTKLAEQNNLFLAGQIHSHPGTFVDLSDIDKRMGIRIPNYLSLVCPHYAQIPSTTLSDCGVHIFVSNAYHKLTSNEAKGLIRLTDHDLTKIKLEVAA